MKKQAPTNRKKYEKCLQNGRGFSCQSGFFWHHFRDSAPNWRKGAPGPQNHRLFIKNLPKSQPTNDISEFSLVSSQHLWRTWGPQDGAKFRTLRSFLFLANPWGEPRSCTLRIFLRVGRCHAARRLQYFLRGSGGLQGPSWTFPDTFWSIRQNDFFTQVTSEDL